ncbi:MAG: type II toxin-antitoxin system death-on-curing family toxin [Bryobacteraceae bacterium]|nr:type II toxin-antitoxin system death-on-curing family toxin [Bryobacteraceae bacterium]
MGAQALRQSLQAAGGIADNRLHRATSIPVARGSAGDPRATDRDLALLESAIAQPQASFSAEFLHASMPAMAAAYLFHICRNHPFVDGNKRVAANAAITFLLNDWDPTLTEDQLVDAVLAVASSSMTKEGRVQLFETHCIPRADTQG